jgi:uncharacterized protein (DUF305 family)
MPRPTRRSALAGCLFAATTCLVSGRAAAQSEAAPSVAAAPAATRSPHWTAADAEFMTGMIGHHAQAVLMAGWAPGHGASPAVLRLCERIVVGQNDEIALMQRWLREWGQPVPEADARHDMMPGMEHMLMPGMLTADELNRLDQATGPAFDRLFLTDMIRHHQGAITMVNGLIGTEGAARDDNVFKLVSDMSADQSIEIERMNGMLDRLAAATTGP